MISRVPRVYESNDDPAIDESDPDYWPRFSYPWTGILQLSAGNGDPLTLDAANGGWTTVNIEITNEEGGLSVIEPWSPWSGYIDSLTGYLHVDLK